MKLSRIGVDLAKNVYQLRGDRGVRAGRAPTTG